MNYMKNTTNERPAVPPSLVRCAWVCAALAVAGCGDTDVEALPQKYIATNQPPPLPIARAVTVVAAESISFGRSEGFPSFPGPTNVSASTFEFSVAASSQPAPKGSIKLAWDARPDISAVGYEIYYGFDSLAYTHRAAVGNVTNTTITGLPEGRRIYFAAVAVDTNGVQSEFSNEVSAIPPHYIHLRQDRWAVEAWGKFGATNQIKMSTNLVDWWTVMTFVGDGSLKTYLHTNTAQAWFRVDQP
jgi:hypothetical protein